ncbi:uncharacterized protein LOC110100785 [Dendrobium catenatum]|nr:uncharacterized protein LOC110100785 [Dendrobium catenatum]
MDAVVFSFCRSLAAFCNHVESSSQALSDSVQRKPIPLDSAATAFLQSLERRISTTSSDLNLLYSMAFDTVSFEELLGYCNEVYKANGKYICEVEDRMKSFGYDPDTGLEDEEYDDFGADARFFITSNGFDGTSSAMRKPLVEDELFNDSISLENLGLSEASLAALASKDNEFSASINMTSQEIKSYDDFQPSQKSLFNEFTSDSLDSTGAAYMKAAIKISEDDYDKLPAFMKKLSSREELQEAVDSFNSYLSGNDGSNENGILDQGVLEKLGLGRKGRTYLLILLRMNRLSAETLNGSIIYHVRSNCP